ncbi:far upstream element-binding protein 3-like isoform X4 [Crassostrea angulata]|uniref:far upstream element-binding protein 3 isoform X5 n=1 Tax=Magallana gigas TaxID=29159 RepID=UPI0022B08290|nr:far upstream element-binding protein 3-like isoform X4 [Crassostrea angulata]
MDAGGQGNSSHQAAFADAVARARQIAAKINQPGAGGGEGSQPLKRPFESDGNSYGEPDQKKTVSAINDPIGAQLKALQEQQSRSEAAQAAQAAAARINQQLGVGPPSSAPPPAAPKPSSHTGGGMVVTEEYAIPDKMVGLIIGKGGEQITRLQAETGCKIQIAPDGSGMPDRQCTLTGSSGAIAACKQQIQDIIMRANQTGGPMMGGMDGNGGGFGGGGGGGGGGMGNGGGQTVVEMMVPGNKVGLVIGKGGETIKQLQERAGVKMVMIQDSNIPSAAEKPLRISGDPQKCQRAKEMVLDLLAEKEMENMNKGFNDYGSYGGGGGGGPPMEIPVPRTAVGIVIGKNGDMIKKIQQESGAKVQFKADDGNSPERVCAIAGSPDKVQIAAQMIQELLNDYNQREGGMGRGFGGGRGRGGPGRGRGGFGGGPGRGMGRGDGFGGFQDETQFAVPADKCGLVIGKGGETIRQINQQSGAHVELQKHPGPNPNEKLFNIKGGPDQIQHAIQMISEKAGIPYGGPGGPGMGGPGGPGPHGGPVPGGPGYGDQYGGQYGAPGQQQGGQYGNGPQGGWGGYNQQQGYPQQQSGDPSQGAINPATGQADYSAAWAEYYRQQGMHYQANMILQQAAAGQSGGAPQGQQPQ